MSDSPKYGKDLKAIVFKDTDHRHAQLLLKLRYDGFRQSEFFKHIVSSYINGDKAFVDYLDTIKPQAKRKIAKSKKLREGGDQLVEDLGLTDGEAEL